jgi:hypothetical protein
MSDTLLKSPQEASSITKEMRVKSVDKKLVSFSDNFADVSSIKRQINDGWSIVSIMNNGNNYVCVLEKSRLKDDGMFVIPPRRKLKLKLS